MSASLPRPWSAYGKCGIVPAGAPLFDSTSLRRPQQPLLHFRANRTPPFHTTLQFQPWSPMIQGVKVADGLVAQFRSIQYGVIPGRFWKAIVVQFLLMFLQCTLYR